jgi:hypothetical protein
MRGKRYSSEDRQDCAAQIMLAGLTETGGATPRADDSRHSLASYCGKAKNVRRSIDRMRDRDQLAAETEQDANAWSIDALTPDVFPSAEITQTEANHAAVTACKRLGLDDSRAPIVTLFYGYARDLPSAVVASELGMSPNGYDVACCRARELIRSIYPTAEEFLTALCGDPVWTVDPMTGEPVLTFSKTDASSEAHNRTHAMAIDWRDGTNAGSWPVRPEDAKQARSACEVYGGSVRWSRPAPKTAEQKRAKAHRQISPLQIQADSLRRLGQALNH